jgi:hypothetical protein
MKVINIITGLILGSSLTLNALLYLDYNYERELRFNANQSAIYWRNECRKVQ